jgi:hypothetical protein
MVGEEPPPDFIWMFAREEAQEIAYETNRLPMVDARRDVGAAVDAGEICAAFAIQHDDDSHQTSSS